MKTSTDATASSEASNSGTTADADGASPPAPEADCCDDGRVESGAVPDAAPEDSDAPSPPSARDGGLLCDPFFGNDAATFCDRATEWCFTEHGFNPTQCVSFGTTCAPYVGVDACASVFDWNTAACNAGDRRCACLSVTCSSGTCQEDDAGGITISCGSCYGAPPAQLERLAV